MWQAAEVIGGLGKVYFSFLHGQASRLKQPPAGAEKAPLVDLRRHLFALGHICRYAITIVNGTVCEGVGVLNVDSCMDVFIDLCTHAGRTVVSASALII